MRISKKILAAVLAALMVISMMPFTAFAATVEVNSAESFESAIASANAGDTIKLTGDVTFDYPSLTYTRLDVGGLTIDLNGHTITSYNNGVVYAGSNYTIKNGNMTCANGGSYALCIVAEDYDDCENWNVSKKGTNVVAEDLVLEGGVNVWASEVTLRNVTAHGTKYYAVWADEEDTVVTVESGSYSSDCTANGAGSKCVIAAAKDHAGTLNIEGGTYTVAEGQTIVLTGATRDVVISGGSFVNEENEPLTVPAQYIADGATQENGVVTQTYVAKIGTTYYATVEDAAAASQEGDTITVLDDIVVTSPIVIAAGDSIKLDLNGFSISGNITEAQGKKLIQVSGELEFVGTKGGCIYGTNTSGQGYAACQALTGGKITVNSPIHFGDSDTDMTNANTVNRGCGIQNNGGTLIINDGYYTAIDSDYVSKPNKYAYAILNCSGDTIVNNATVYGEPNGNLGCEAGTLTVNGGTYEVKSANYYSLYAFGGVTTVNGGTFVNNGQYGVNYLGTGAETVIKGGTFTYTAPFNNSGSKGNPVVSGGTFSNEVAAKYIEENYECVGPTEGWYTIVPAAVDTMSITIEDNIDINIYLDDSTASEEYFKIDRVEYTYNKTPDLEQNNPETVSAPATRNADGKVVLNIELAPGQIRDVISIVAYSESNTKVRDFETSIAEYCEAIIEGNYPSDLKDLAKSTLDYGKGASRYFGYNTEAYNNYSIQLDDPTDQINAIAQAAANNTIDTSKFTITGVSYRATSKPEIRFYIDPESTSEDELAGYNRTVVSTIGTAYFAKHDDDYLLIVKDIDITDFNKQFVVTVKDSIDPSNDWDVVHFTPITWVKAAIGSEDENLAFFAKTIGNYYLKSVNYFGA